MMQKKGMLIFLTLLLWAGLTTAAAAADGSKLVAVTFDDGPSLYTSGLLDELAKRDVVVTFFVQGCNAERYGSVIKRAYEAGHQIASHTYNHPNLVNLSTAEVQNQLNRTANILNKAIGQENTYMLRPPYGSYNASVLAASGVPAVLWSVDTLDWQSRRADAVYQHIVNDTRDGSIILMHDLYSSTVDGALRGIDYLQEQGYELVTVSELLRRRGITPEAGSRYSSAYNKGQTLPGIAVPQIEAEYVEGRHMVSITADEGAKIYYTLDGSRPNGQSPVYTGPFALDEDATVRAFAAFSLNGGRSGLSEVRIEMPRTPAPKLELAEGQLSIAAEGGQVYYTLDGTLPSPLATPYTEPFAVEPGTVIKALALQEGFRPSLVSYLYYSPKGNVFADIEPENWCAEDVDQTVAAGLLTLEQGRFRPNDLVTRRDLVTVLYRLAGSPPPQEELAPARAALQQGADDAVRWAAEQGILTDLTEDEALLDKPLTREQLAVMLYRFGGSTKPSQAVNQALQPFADAGSISGYAVDALRWAVSQGIITGVSADLLEPAGTTTRAELATIVLRCQSVWAGSFSQTVHEIELQIKGGHLMPALSCARIMGQSVPLAGHSLFVGNPGRVQFC